jgi:steroid 5-alpha reductase family enzyme
MVLVEAIWISALVMLSYMTILFMLSVVLKDNSIADIAWGPGFVIVALTLFLISAEYTIGQILVTTLIAIWGFRLGIRILMRNWGRGEDFRYQKWRKQWGKYFFIRSYLQVFLTQGFLLLLIIFPVYIINAYGQESLSWLEGIGILIWLVGFFFETVGDYQLDKFLKNPANKGRILDSGLWKYTRHPNYFGEVTQWWGIFVLGIGLSYGWLGIVGPMTITFLILKVSGIPMLEKAMSKNPAFLPYKEKTSVFIPWFPKKS